MATLHPNEDLGKLLSQTGLIDLHQYRHPNTITPATYHRGQHTIDICLRTTMISHAILGAWFLPFGQPDTLPGDHRTIGLDFDWQYLFGDKIPPRPLQIHRGVNSNAYPMVLEFSKMVVTDFNNHQIASRIETLLNIPTFTEREHKTLERLDLEITEILIKADKKCQKYNRYPWSPALHQAYLLHRYWNVRLSQAKTKRDYSVTLQRIIDQLQSPPETTGTISSNLRKAQKQLKIIQKQAVTKRDEFLQSLQQTAETTNDKNRKKLIMKLRMAELN